MPIIFFGSGSPPEYHTASDEIDVVSIEKPAQITRHVELADPASIGFDDPIAISLLTGWVRRLDAYVANPPTTDEEWAAYEEFVKSIITTVYQFIGGEAHS